MGRERKRKEIKMINPTLTLPLNLERKGRKETERQREDDGYLN